ncbi:MAG: conjugal transfer protein TraK [Bacteroidales bacterium]|nr:conjugal transfer protein TraK [Bacteroidales bacterium]
MMDKPKIDIYKTLIINRLVVWGLLISFVCSSAIFAFSINNLYTKQLNTVLVLDSNGEVIPMKWMQRDENIKVEIKDHLEKFHTYFYQYDAFNVEKSLEKALWFGDNSIEQLYIKRKNDGWYTKVSSYGIKQTIEILSENIEILGNNEPYSFRVKAGLSITQDDQTVRYSFETTGLIIFVSRNYPLNPHGLLITRFAENNRIEIK